MIIARKFDFDAAHYLENYHGSCEKMHGHTYKLVVKVDGQVDPETGVVMYFRDIKRIVKEKVLTKIDHNLINEVLKVPTAENIAKWIWEQLKPELNLVEIELYESKDSYVIYNGN